MHVITVVLLVLGAVTVSRADDNLDTHEVLKRLLSALSEKKEEKPVHRSVLDELEQELAKRKEAVGTVLYCFVFFLISLWYLKIIHLSLISGDLNYSRLNFMMFWWWSSFKVELDQPIQLGKNNRFIMVNSSEKVSADTIFEFSKN